MDRSDLGWYDYFLRDFTSIGMPRTNFFQAIMSDKQVHDYNPKRYHFYMQLLQGLLNPASKSIVDTVLTLEASNKMRHEQIKERSNDIASALKYLFAKAKEDNQNLQSTDIFDKYPFLAQLNKEFKSNPLLMNMGLKFEQGGGDPGDDDCDDVAEKAKDAAEAAEAAVKAVNDAVTDAVTDVQAAVKAVTDAVTAVKNARAAVENARAANISVEQEAIQKVEDAKAKVENAVNQLKTYVQAAPKEVIDVIENAVAAVKDAITTDAITDAITDAVTDAIIVVKVAAAVRYAEYAAKVINEATDADQVINTLTNAVTAVNTAADAVKTPVTDAAVTSLVEALTNAAKALTDAKTAKYANNKKEEIDTLVTQVTDTVNKLTSYIQTQATITSPQVGKNSSISNLFTLKSSQQTQLNTGALDMVSFLQQKKTPKIFLGKKVYGKYLQKFDAIENDPNKSRHDKDKAIDDLIVMYKKDPITSPSNGIVTSTDKIIFIGVTFVIRAIALFLVQWGVNTSFVRTFQEAFMLFIATYVALFTLWYILIKSSDNIVILRVMFFYLGCSKGFRNYIIHVFISCCFISIPFIVKSTSYESDMTTAISAEEKYKIISSVSNLTFMLWILTSLLTIPT